MPAVAETPVFREVAKLFDEERELVNFLATKLVAGDEIPGTGGVRKVRFAASASHRKGT